MQIFEWAIEDIVAAYPSLSVDEDAAMAVALMRHAPTPCDFQVKVNGFYLADLGEETQFVLRLTWSAETGARAKRIERTKQRTPIVERGAVAVALLLIAHLLPKSDLELVVHGEGPDYWLPQSRHALEISGTERFHAVPRRIREKRKQLAKNWRSWDGYTIVCCFAASHRFIQWSYYPNSR